MDAPLKKVITIDGPAGSGKSTMARLLARRLGYRYLDTGAMYRALTWKALRSGVNLEDEEALAALAESTRLTLDPVEGGVRVIVDGRDVSQEIRDVAVTQQVYHLADNVKVRERMVQLQREFAARGPVVTEGRDQGTVAFPDAKLKVYLDASDEERARRRLEELRRAGKHATFEGVLAHVRERDQRDLSRPVGALKRAPDAVTINTTGKTIEQTLDTLMQEVLSRK